MKKIAVIETKSCVACGVCAGVCPRSAIRIVHGQYADVDASQCVGCGICAKSCPAAIISVAAKIKPAEGEEV